MRRLAFLFAIAAAPIALPAQAETFAPPPVLSGLAKFEQVALTTSDLERAISFYRDTVGLPLLFETNGMAFFDVGGVRLMVAGDDARQSVQRPQSILYFQVADFDASVARLSATPAKLVGPVETVQSTGQGDLKLQQFEDPDGNALALMGLVPKG